VPVADQPGAVPGHRAGPGGRLSRGAGKNVSPGAAFIGTCEPLLGQGHHLVEDRRRWAGHVCSRGPPLGTAAAPGAAPDPHYRVRHRRRSDCWVTSSRVRRPGRNDPGCAAPLTWCSLSLARMAGNGRTEIRGQVVGEIHSMGGESAEYSQARFSFLRRCRCDGQGGLGGRHGRLCRNLTAASQ